MRGRAGSALDITGSNSKRPYKTKGINQEKDIKKIRNVQTVYATYDLGHLSFLSFTFFLESVLTFFFFFKSHNPASSLLPWRGVSTYLPLPELSISRSLRIEGSCVWKITSTQESCAG